MKKFLNILILVLAVSLVWQLHHAGKLTSLEVALKNTASSLRERFATKPETAEEGRKPIASADQLLSPEDATAAPSPTPEVTAEATPAPTPEATPSATPSSTPAVTVSSTPAPEAPVDLSTLDRRFWPKQVKLTKAVQFAIASNGKEIGKIDAPAGMMVKLLDIRGSQLEVELASGSVSKLISAVDTDIQDRIRELKALMGDGTAATAKPAGSATPWVPQYKDRSSKSALHK